MGSRYVLLSPLFRPLRSGEVRASLLSQCRVMVGLGDNDVLRSRLSGNNRSGNRPSSMVGSGMGSTGGLAFCFFNQFLKAGIITAS